MTDQRVRTSAFVFALIAITACKSTEITDREGELVPAYGFLQAEREVESARK